MAFRKYLQIVERRGPSRDVRHRAARPRRPGQGVLRRPATRVEALADALTTPTRTASVQPDEEHQAFALVLEDRSGGYPRHHRLDHDFVTTGEFRTLAASYQDVKGIRGPMIVKTTGAAADDEDRAARRRAQPRTRPRSAARRSTKRRSSPPSRSRSTLSSSRRQSPKAPRDADVRVESLDELVEFFIAAGKKGVAINRYKGLGEMNPDTLWETTMDPRSGRCRRSRPKTTWKPT